MAFLMAMSSVAVAGGGDLQCKYCSILDGSWFRSCRRGICICNVTCKIQTKRILRLGINREPFRFFLEIKRILEENKGQKIKI